MPFDTTLRRNWDALASGDVNSIFPTWADSDDIRYDNPAVGAAALGRSAVRQRITLLSQELIERGERLAIDRITEGDAHAIVEWHVDPAADDLRGVHVVQFGPDGKIIAMAVYLGYEP